MSAGIRVGNSTDPVHFACQHPATWEVLRQDLLSRVATEDAQEGIRTRYGQKYIVRGILKAPSGTLAHIVTVWIVLHGELIPRFVTAYPGSE